MISPSENRQNLSSSFACLSRWGGATRRPVITRMVICAIAAAASVAMAQAGLNSDDPAPSVGLLNSRALALNPTNSKLYAVDAAAGTISIADGRTHVTSIVKVGAHPVAVAVNPSTNRAYVANNGSASISVVDGSTDAVVATLAVGRTPYVVAVNSVTNRIYVSNTFNNLITIIDGATNATRTVKAGSADAILVDANKNKIYLLNYESSTFTVLDGTTDAILHRAAGKMHLWGFAQDAAMDEIYVGRVENADVAALRDSSDAPIAIPTGKIPSAIAINPRTNRIYVANYEDASVTVVDGGKHLAIATIPVGEHPQAVAVDPDANLIYVANTHDNSVTVLDGATNRSITTLSAGHSPYALAVDSKNDLLYVSDLGDRSLTQIDVHALREHAALRQQP
jgi:YVTN family beta-propeller protein